MIITNLLLTTIFSLTNFSVQHSNFDYAAKHNYFRYCQNLNLSEYNKRFVQNLYDNDYICSETSITVLTHGMFGNNKYWFPKTDDFETLYFDSESLAYKLVNCNNFDIDYLPILFFGSFSETDIVQNETENDGPNDENEMIFPVQIKQLKKISDTEFGTVDFDLHNFDYNSQLLSNHIILVYNAPKNVDADNASNYEVARVFQEALDNVLATFSVYYGGKLPKINLIGHSRGGITNLYYCDVREKLVDNFISISTPFEGSLWAETLDAFINLYNIVKNENLNGYSAIFDENDILYNIGMLNTINVNHKVAIGCEMTQDLFFDEIVSFLQPLLQNQQNDDGLFKHLLRQLFEKLIRDNFINNTVTNLCDDVISTTQAIKNTLNFVNGFDNAVDNLCSFLNLNTVTMFDRELEASITLLDKVSNLFQNIRQFDTNNSCIKGDFCVDLNSQLCNINGSSPFDEEIIIPFGMEGTSNLVNKYLSTEEALAFVHNYESNFPEITNYILNILSTNDSLHSHVFNTLDICSCGFSRAIEEINPSQIPFYYFDNNFLTNIYEPDGVFNGSEFGFREKYYFEDEINFNDSSFRISQTFGNTLVTTKRLRACYVRNDKLTLSPNREGAGFAYIEFLFERPVYDFSFDISLWSDDESVVSSNLTFVYSTDENFREYLGSFMFESLIEENHLYTQTLRGQYALLENKTLFNQYYNEVQISSIPTNRETPSTIRVNSSSKFNAIGFYVACNPTTSTKNKGRICLSNFEYYLCESPLL